MVGVRLELVFDKNGLLLFAIVAQGRWWSVVGQAGASNLELKVDNDDDDDGGC